MLRALLTRTAIRPRAAGALRSFAKPAATAASTAEVSRFPGAATAFTTTMDIQAPQSKRPVFRVMNEQGKILIPNYVDKVKNWSHAFFFNMFCHDSKCNSHALRSPSSIPRARTPQIDNATLVEMYKASVTLQAMDLIFYDAQRQGRISFYMQVWHTVSPLRFIECLGIPHEPASLTPLSSPPYSTEHWRRVDCDRLGSGAHQ
jgi:hypothetical protein